MKKITLLITLFLALNAIVFAQKDAEKAFFYTLDDQYNASMVSKDSTIEEEVKNTIKKLDIEEAIAFTALDFTMLDKLWASNFRVNNPRNSISLSAEEVRQGLKTGRIKHQSIDRHIEQIFFQETMVVTMGNEDVKETDGHIIKRRYTNVWQKQGNDWKLSFRHANLVCP